MRKLVVGSMALAAVLAGPATAADLAPVPVVVEPVFNWSGLYLGVSGGRRWSHVTWTTLTVTAAPGVQPDLTTTPADFSNSAGRFGGYIGYNWQFAPSWLWGLEGDFAWSNSSKIAGGVPGTFGTSGLFAPPDAVNFDRSWVRERWDAGIRVRVGFIVTSTWLIYAAGGFALQSIEVAASCSGTGASWCMDGIPRSEPITYVRTGWTIAAGLEAALWRNVLARVEYRYTDYGNIDFTFFTVPPTGDDVQTRVSLKSQTVLGGIAYKFDF